MLIKRDDFIQSITEALQYISYYHSESFIKAMSQAYQREESASAKSAIKQILINSKMSAIGHRPLCQDTGIVSVFVNVGIKTQWDTDSSLQEMVDEGVRRAYSWPDNVLRASIVADPLKTRKNTGDNTPSSVHCRLVAGEGIEVWLSSKGGGSENKSKFVMLNPSDDVADWVEKVVPSMGAGWCPPGVLGIGVGGTADKAMMMAKESLFEPINMLELIDRGPKNHIEELRIDIYNRVNALGIGAQGLGGLTTVLDVKIKDFPTHAVSKPVAMIPNCAATRTLHFKLDGSGPAIFTPPNLDLWPDLEMNVAEARRVNLDTLTREDTRTWKTGETLLISGKLLTGRDAAHKRIDTLFAHGESLPEGVDFTNKFIYYVGPVDPVRNEVVGPAGPTTADRMDKFTDMMLAKTGLLGMIGKAERGPEGLRAIKAHEGVYLIAVGGAAYLVSQAIKSSKIIAFADLGMEAIREFEVLDMPVTVAVDTQGESIHATAPAIWRKKIQENNKK
ncbi:MAG: fumarate hydratase [Pseudomonadota bacterium]